MSTLLASVDRNAKATSKPAVVSDLRRTQLLLGALLHDVGHMPFSHASEKFLEELSERTPDRLRIGDLTAIELRRLIGEAMRKHLHLAEVLSVLVLLSPRLQSFLKAIAPQDEQASEDFFLQVAAFISGSPLSNADLAYSMVLSGPLDTDRLDYMARDSVVSGVPVSVDIPRLLARCSFSTVPAQKLPLKRRELLDDQSDVTLFATDLSGANALEELAVSRFILHDRVYYHQKTRAAESILAELLDETFTHKPTLTLLGFWSMNDEAFLHDVDDITRPLTNRLLYRNLPKRAVVFSNRLLRRPVLPFALEVHSEEAEAHEMRMEQGVADLLDEIDEALRIPTSRKQLQDTIRALAVEMASKVPENYRPLGEPLVVASGRTESPFSSVGEALVVDVDGNVSEFSEFMPLGQWSAAYDLNKKRGYVFTDPGWEYLVHIASELTLWNHTVLEEEDLHFRFSLSHSAAMHAKLQPTILFRLKEHLDHAGFFDKAWPLRPVVVTEPRIQQLASRFATFQGAGKWTITPQWLEMFLRQFPINLQQKAAEVLGQLRFLDRGTLTELVERGLQDLEGDKLHVYALTPNSGALIRIITEADTKTRLKDRVEFFRTHPMSPLDTGATIVFVDDIIATGSQARTQFQAWMGVPRDNWADPNEINILVDPLPSDVRETLLNSRVRILYAVGSTTGRQHLEAALTELGFKDARAVCMGSLESDRGLIDVDVQKFLQCVGEDLLSAEANRSAADALGYGGVSSPIATMINVPTCCPVALWKPGMRNGSPWLPLFIRRGNEDRSRFH